MNLIQIRPSHHSPPPRSLEEDVLAQILNRVEHGGLLQPIIQELKEGGLAEAVRSWMDPDRENIAVSADQLKCALDASRMTHLSDASGFPLDDLYEGLARRLPRAALKARNELIDGWPWPSPGVRIQYRY